MYMNKKLCAGLMALSLAAVSMGCTGLTRTQEGALTGGAIGAIGGTAIGAAAGNAGVGALVGAGAGAVVGGLIGNEQEY